MGNRSSLCILLAGVFAFTTLAFQYIDETAVTIDEFGHLPAGVSYLQTCRFGLYRESPPLLRCVTAFPAWVAGARISLTQAFRGRRTEAIVGRDFARAAGKRYSDYLSAARIVVLILGIGCAGLIYWWSRELYGPSAALVSAGLWLTDPNVLAHSGLVTTDIGTAFFAIIAAYSFWRFLTRPTMRRALTAGLTLGLAEVCKFSMLALYPLWVVFAVLAYNRTRQDPEATSYRSYLKQVTTIMLLSLLVINSAYLFEGSLLPLGGFDFRSRMLSGVATSEGGVAPAANKFRGTWLAGIPVPLPRNYVLGLDSQTWDSETGLARVDHGRLVRGGCWYDPLIALLYKLPLGSLFLLIAAIGSAATHFRSPRLESAFPLMAALFIIGLLCTQTGLNSPVRYALPAIAFLAVAIGGPIAAVWSHSWWRALVFCCLGANCISVWSSGPYYLSYGNELVGGDVGVQRHMIGSNYDWGQDLYRLKAWADRNRHLRPLKVTYYGALEPELVGLVPAALPISFVASPTQTGEPDDSSLPSDFFWVISSNTLHGLTTPVSLGSNMWIEGVFQSPLLTPENAFARIGSTLYVFHVVPGATSRTARTLSVRELTGCIREMRDGDLTAAP